MENPRVDLQEKQYLAAQEKEAIRDLLDELAEQEIENVRQMLREWPDSIAA